MLLKLLPHHVSIDLEEQRGQRSFQVWPILAAFEPLVFDSSKLLPSFFSSSLFALFPPQPHSAPCW